MIDSLLEAMSAKCDNESPNSRDQAEQDEPAEPSWMSNGAIYELAQSAEITPSEAFEYLRRCHNCGSKLAIFGSVYCKEICQQCCEDSHCDCFWGDSCQVCTSGEFVYWNLLDSTFKPEEYQDELPSELTIYLEDPSRSSVEPGCECEPDYPDCSWCWQYHCKYLSILSCRNPKCELCYCNICDDNVQDYRGFQDCYDYEGYLDSRDIYDYQDNQDNQYGYDYDDYRDNQDSNDIR